MNTLSPSTQKLITRYQVWYKSLQPKPGVATIHVDEVASRVAAFYEKLRALIDWKEEHLLKRGAIERGLKRRILAQGNWSDEEISGTAIAEPLLLELVRGGHFPNDSIEESKITEAQRLIDKYLAILRQSPPDSQRSLLQLGYWLLSIAACELEEILSPSVKERALIDYMFEVMKERIRVPGTTRQETQFNEQEKNVQIYIAVQRALFKLDPPVISYHLLKYRYPNWKNFGGSQLKDLASNIYRVWESIEKELSHPLADKFYQLCERYDTPYLLLGDVLAEDPIGIKEKLVNPEYLENLTRNAYQKRLRTIRSRFGRAAFYATVSIFLSKVAVALAIELPLDRYLTGQLNSFALGVNIAFPPLLMFLLISTIQPPRRGNLEQVIIEVMKIAYQREKMDFYDIKVSRKRRNAFIYALVKIFYALFFLLVFGLIIFMLYKFNFPLFSDLIFIVFVSLIAFAGTKIRQRAKELQVTEDRMGLFSLIVDPFAIPLIQLGKWLTIRWQRYNILSTFFNALIDMPLLTFVEFLEQWGYFLKEKKEGIH